MGDEKLVEYILKIYNIIEEFYVKYHNEESPAFNGFIFIKLCSDIEYAVP